MKLRFIIGMALSTLLLLHAQSVLANDYSFFLGDVALDGGNTSILRDTMGHFSDNTGRLNLTGFIDVSFHAAKQQSVQVFLAFEQGSISQGLTFRRVSIQKTYFDPKKFDPNFPDGNLVPMDHLSSSARLDASGLNRLLGAIRTALVSEGAIGASDPLRLDLAAATQDGKKNPDYLIRLVASMSPRTGIIEAPTDAPVSQRGVCDDFKTLVRHARN